MLSLFPSLLTFEQISPTILRLTLAVVFIFWAFKRFKKEKRSDQTVVFAILELLVGILLVIGLFTQLAALVATIIMLIQLIQKMRDGSFMTDGVNYYFILFVISLGLIFTGPGFFSFDLPL